MLLPLAKIGFLAGLGATVWAISGILLILIILVQKGKGGGLGSAFGGAGSSLLGTKTGDFLTWVTIGLVAVFLLLSIVMAKAYHPTDLEILKAKQADTAAVDDSLMLEEGLLEDTGDAAAAATEEAAAVTEEAAGAVQEAAAAVTEAAADAVATTPEAAPAAE